MKDATTSWFESVVSGASNAITYRLFWKVNISQNRDDVIGGVGPQVRDVFGGFHKNVGVGRLGVDVRNAATLKVQQNDEALKIWQSLAT